MLIPRILSSRMRAFRRAKGHNAVNGAAYRAGIRLVDGRGRTHDYSRRDGVVGTRLSGWNRRPGESLEEAINRLWVAAQEAETKKNRVEAREIRFDLVNGGGARGERSRDAICRLTAAKVRRDTGVAVQISRHSEGEGGPGTLQHAHMMVTDRRVDADGNFAAAKDTRFKHATLGPAYVRELREFVTDLNNRAAGKLGLEVVFSAAGYTETYGQINHARTREGLEPLEIPTDGEHEGPSLSAIRRRCAAEDLPITHPVLRQNDLVVARNTAIHARNRARIGRDGLLRELQPRLAAYAELRRLSAKMGHDNAEGGPWRAEDQRRHGLLTRQAGNTLDLRKILKALPPETLSHIAARHPDVVEPLLRREAYQQKVRGGPGLGPSL